MLNSIAFLLRESMRYRLYTTKLNRIAAATIQNGNFQLVDFQWHFF